MKRRPDILRPLSFQFVRTGSAGKRKSADALHRASGDKFEALIYSPNSVSVKCQVMLRWTIKTAGKLELTWRPSSAKSCCLWMVVFLLGGTSSWLRKRTLYWESGSRSQDFGVNSLLLPLKSTLL